MKSPGIDIPNRMARILSVRGCCMAMAATLILPGIGLAQTDAAAGIDAHASHNAHTPVKEKSNPKAKPAKEQKASPTSSNDMQHMDHSQMDHSKMEGMDHGSMEGLDHSKMGDMKMQGGSAPPDARDPDYSDGVSPGSMTGMQGMHGESSVGMVLFDRLEQFHGDGANGQAIGAQAWYGTDLSKLWFKFDGERSGGHLGASRAELLWDRPVSAYWDVQVGARHDFGEGPGRNWAAFGFQGLAPYWFDVQATAYVGESGRTALRLEVEYDVLLTQRLILQPDLEANFYGKDDPSRDIGSGLSDVEFGLRLRYEITRKFAPYFGVVWSKKFGQTADYVQAVNEDVNDTQLVAGLRLWF